MTVSEFPYKTSIESFHSAASKGDTAALERMVATDRKLVLSRDLVSKTEKSLKKKIDATRSDKKALIVYTCVLESDIFQAHITVFLCKKSIPKRKRKAQKMSKS